MIKLKKVLLYGFVCLPLLAPAFRLRAQIGNPLANVEADITSLMYYLGLEKKADRQDLARLAELKMKTLAADATEEQRQAAYTDLFLMIYRLQGNPEPSEADKATLINYARAAAGVPAGATRGSSGWATSTTPLGKLGHVEKMGSGPIPVILIPNQEGWSLYKSFMEKNRDKFTFYAVTLPGYGGTPPPPRPERMDLAKLSWWSNAEQAVVNLIKDEKINKPIVVGTMYGAYLAARLALDHPDKVRGAVLINGLVYANQQQTLAERHRQARLGIAAFPSAEMIPWSRRPPAAAVKKAIEANPQALAQIQNWAKDPETAKSLVVEATVNNHPASARYGSELVTTDLTDDLKDLKVPMLVIPALSDPESPYQGKIALTQFEEIKAKYPSIPMTIRPFENVRQYVLFEAGDRLGKEIEAFFSEQKRAEKQIPPEAQKRLDHHIGKWKIKIDYLDANGKVVYSTTGTDEVRYIIDRRVVEMTTSIPDLPSFSKGWMFYSIPEETFYVTSVDREGQFWIMSGGLDEYVITSKPKRQPDGTEMMIRFTHSDIKEDSFEALMEYSKDAGKTWKARFKQYLTRHKDGQLRSEAAERG